MAPWLLFMAFLGISGPVEAAPVGARPTIQEVRDRYAACVAVCTTDECRRQCDETQKVDLEIAN